MSDPRQEDREQGRRRSSWEPTQMEERIRLGLSPVDDALPFAQAIRNQEEMAKATKIFGERRRLRKAGLMKP